MRILVTDAHELAGLGAVRSLGRANYHVTAGYPAHAARPASTYSRYCRTRRVYPDPWASQPEFCAWLIKHAADWDLILPISEAALVAVANCQPNLPPTTRVVAPAPNALEITLSKRLATKKAQSVGLPCPAAAFDAEELVKLRPPYIVRTDNRLMNDGSYQKGRTWYIDGLHELMHHVSELDEGGERWIAQEYVVGTGTGAFLLTWREQVLLEFAHERVHEVPFYGGVSSLRSSARGLDTIPMAKRLIHSIEYEGVAMCEFRRCAKTQAPYFIEINGRLWGSLALALHAGVDFPLQLVRCYESNPQATAKSKFRELYCRNVYPGEIDYMRSVLTAGGPVRGIVPPGKAAAIIGFFALFFSPRVRYDYLWVTDPLPCLWHGLSAIKKIIGSRWQARKRRYKQARLLKAFALQAPDVAPDLSEVLFVCYGNICRSAFAGAYWNQRMHRPALSAGFIRKENRRTPLRIVQLAKDLGVDLTGHRSKLIDSAVVETATAIFVMDGQNIEELLEEFPHARPKTWLLGSFGGVGAIQDPYLLADREALQSLQQIKASIDHVISKGANSQALPAVVLGGS